jgi:hypothetical protein
MGQLRREGDREGAIGRNNAWRGSSHDAAQFLFFLVFSKRSRESRPTWEGRPIPFLFFFCFFTFLSFDFPFL